MSFIGSLQEKSLPEKHQIVNNFFYNFFIFLNGYVTVQPGLRIYCAVRVKIECLWSRVLSHALKILGCESILLRRGRHPESKQNTQLFCRKLYCDIYKS